MKKAHSSKSEVSWRRLIYMSVFIFFAFFLLLDLLAGSIVWIEFLVLLIALLIVLLLIEATVRLWNLIEKSLKK